MTAINRFHFILLLVVIHLRFLSPLLSSCVYFCFVPVLYFLCFCFFYPLFFLQYFLHFLSQSFTYVNILYTCICRINTYIHRCFCQCSCVHECLRVYMCMCVCVCMHAHECLCVCTTLSVHIFVNSLSSTLGETIYSLPPFCSTSSIHSHTIPSIFHRCPNNLKYSAS